MANLVRVRTTWNGTAVVGEGVSTFYFTEAHTGFVADLTAFWTTLKGNFPAGITLRTDNTGDLVDIDTGQLSGTWTDTAGSPVLTTGAGVFAQGVGARVKWTTTGIRNGRRVRGATFLCPLINGSYESDGSLTSTFITAATTACNTLLTDSGTFMRTYSRPVPGQGGQASPVTAALIPDKISWLRSRRT